MCLSANNVEAMHDSAIDVVTREIIYRASSQTLPFRHVRVGITDKLSRAN